MRFVMSAAVVGILAMQGAEAGLKAVDIPPDTPIAAAAPARAATRAEVPADDRDEFYDRDNPGFTRLQRAGEALGGLPVDQDGKPDWMTSLRTQSITPRQRLDDAPRPAPLDLDVVMRNTKQMPNVRFPHRAHTEWLDCSNCHPAPFAEKAGSTAIRMEDIFRGRFCGMCHDRVAFVTHRNCYRCHSVPQQGTASAAR
ncbi:c(7)-type cytochrome triheme domain-containing protein [Aromatoleum sp.]|uniref:c(7)-type cytochrome triheme domain-containing protein n=1 Tax=Aromatoleum sp. TaxID=2307007 RepID=UPI002FCC8EA4